jgi:hypothetical protein
MASDVCGAAEGGAAGRDMVWAWMEDLWVSIEYMEGECRKFMTSIEICASLSIVRSI